MCVCLCVAIWLWQLVCSNKRLVAYRQVHCSNLLFYLLGLWKFKKASSLKNGFPKVINLSLLLLSTETQSSWEAPLSCSQGHPERVATPGSSPARWKVNTHTHTPAHGCSRDKYIATKNYIWLSYLHQPPTLILVLQLGVSTFLKIVLFLILYYPLCFPTVTLLCNYYVIIFL